jgi:hypothetical protein
MRFTNYKMLSNNISESAVVASVNALLSAFSGNSGASIAEVRNIITHTQTDFLSRSKELDIWLEKNQEFNELADILFDLLMVQFLSAELHEEDYFDSAEWNEIENKTLDKGSEMLNLFLYLSESRETEVEVTLDDFLHEFLLVGEDEFQDEYRIYESLITNEDLLEVDLAAVREAGKSVKSDTGLQDYFVPLVMFFQHAEGVNETDLLPEGLDKFEKAILSALIAYNEF